MNIKIDTQRHVPIRLIYYADMTNTLYIHIPNPIKFLKYGVKYPIMHWFNVRYRTGICECGHISSEHHGGIIANINYAYSPREIHGTLRQECEHNGFNGYEFADGDGNICRCSTYVDIGWIFKLNKNYKYRLDINNLKNNETSRRKQTNK